MNDDISDLMDLLEQMILNVMSGAKKLKNHGMKYNVTIYQTNVSPKYAKPSIRIDIQELTPRIKEFTEDTNTI